jgi:2-oxoglutarate ferredoxin oxidoreductase subunit alpha
MMQRGGPSTGTVNFSQQEVNLAAFGGNGDGLRVVYSASSVSELYELTIQAFNAAWQYRFPTILLGDGYLGKTSSTVLLKKPTKLISSYPILKEEVEPTCLRNCYSSEESLGKILKKNISDWNKTKPLIVKSESFNIEKAEILIVAHGLVASAAKEAVAKLNAEKVKIGLFRPITLNPLDSEGLKKAAQKAKKIFIIESSLNQFSRIVKYELAGMEKEFIEISKPAEGFTPEEIIEKITKLSS